MTTADELRRQAEERLDRLAADAAAAAASPVPEDVAAAVHELRVHQIELEMQNEELRRAQLELEASREKYFELFDLAPVGYLTLGDRDIVGDANLTAAHLLGVERQLLVGQPFSASRRTASHRPSSCGCSASAATPSLSTSGRFSRAGRSVPPTASRSLAGSPSPMSTRGSGWRASSPG
jgi:PAS domain-containing protein